MGTLKLDLTSFEVTKKQDIDRDEPYLWVFPIVLDSTRLVSPDHTFVVPRRPTYGNIGEHYKKGETRKLSGHFAEATIPTNTNLFGLLKVGVAVAAWEHDKTSSTTQEAAYKAAVSDIDQFIWKNLATLTTTGTFKESDITEALVKDVKKIFTKDFLKRFFTDTLFGAFLTSSGIGALAGALKAMLGNDDFIGLDTEFYDEDQGLDPTKSFEDAFKMTFAKGSTEYTLKGKLQYRP